MVSLVSQAGRLSGKVALVTGAGSRGNGVGIGEAIALRFAAEGASVCLVDHDAGRAEQTWRAIAVAGGEAFVSVADVTRAADCRRVVDETVQRYGQLHILVNNVGVAQGKNDPLQLDEADWDRVMALNLKSAVLMSTSALPALLEAGTGAIVNISSIAGSRAQGSGLAYGPSKAAMNAVTRELSVRYGRQGLRANTVAPGHVMTPLVAGLASANNQELRRKVAPLGVEGNAWDVAAAVLFLASDEARFISGVLLPVDGGVLGLAPLGAWDLLNTP